MGWCKVRPAILNRDRDEGDDGGGKVDYQPTPRQPNWSNRLLHQAMGVPTDDSPANTVLSKVSTAAPSTHGSIDMIATESRHSLRGKQSGMQLERLAGMNESPAVEDEFSGPMDPPEEMSQESSAGGDKRGVDPEEKDYYKEPEDEEEISAKPSAKSAASSQPDPLENSLGEVVDNNSQDYDNDDDEGGGMQFATQQDDQFDDDNDFGGGNDGGFDDEEVSHQASQKSRDSSKASSKSEQQPEESEDESPPQKKKSKKSSKQAPITPTSVLRTKKSKKKKQQHNRHVNFSTPNGRSTGIPMANRDYKSIPVSEYKDSYAPGEEPRTPGGTTVLRRSGRAKFKPLSFWKNEKLIYEAQNEKGLLGEAMGDMPVVSGVMHALPTMYKEPK